MNALRNDVSMPYPSDDERLHAILDMISKVAALDFSKTLGPSDKNDMIDAIAIGLNMLSEELNTRVVEKSKLDEVNSKLEKFAYTTAHDLKSPLNSIEGLVGLLEISLDPQQMEVVEYLTRLKVTVNKMKDLVQGILNYSKADFENIQREEISLSGVLIEIMETDQFLHSVNVQINGTLPLIHFNKSAIYQIFRNLIGNAVKYCDKEICELKITTSEMKDHYQISIGDNGPGIPPSKHEGIFQPFNKMNSGKRADSHGVGLSVVKQILETAGEKIWVESAIGKGATFVFTLRK
jgi:signal transduction histidine kinase